MEIMKYKDFEGTAGIDVERQVCMGKILFIDDLITFEADNPVDLFRAFCEAVDDYMETCVELGKQPEKPLKGAFNVRVPPELHKKAIRKAVQMDIYLNDVVVRALDLFINGNSNVNHVTNYYVQQGESKFKTHDISASTSTHKWTKTRTGVGIKNGN